MRQFIAPEILIVDGKPSPCRCEENITCSYCIQANLSILENPLERIRTKEADLSVGCHCRQYGLCMECQEKIELEKSPIIALREEIEEKGIRTVSRELGVDHKTITHWIERESVPGRYIENGELVGKEAISRG